MAIISFIQKRGLDLSKQTVQSLMYTVFNKFYKLDNYVKEWIRTMTEND